MEGVRLETLSDFKGRSSCSSWVCPASSKKLAVAYLFQIWCAGTFMKWVTPRVTIPTSCMLVYINIPACGVTMVGLSCDVESR